LHAFKLMHLHEEARQQNYDFVIRARFDVIYHVSAPSLTQLNYINRIMLSFQRHKFVNNSYDNSPFEGEINDKFTILPRRYAKMFVDSQYAHFSSKRWIKNRELGLKEKLIEFCGRKRSWTPECSLTYHVAKNNISMNDIYTGGIACTNQWWKESDCKGFEFACDIWKDSFEQCKARLESNLILLPTPQSNLTRIPLVYDSWLPDQIIAATKPMN